MGANTIVQEILKLKNIDGLWETQQRALDAGLLKSSDNFVIVAPTASGKTLNAEFVIWQVLKSGGKVIYLVPLTALATEKANEFDYMNKDYSVSAKGKWEKADLIITTFEVFYKKALMSKQFLERFSLAIVDEFHVLYDRTRGFNLEKAITLLKKENIRIICLSATFNDKEEISSWLNAKLVEIPEKQRSVPLKTGYMNLTKYSKAEQKSRFYSALIRSRNRYPYLLFCSRRDHTRSRALELCSQIKKTVGNSSELRNEIREKVSRRNLTSLEEDLLRCLNKKVAFHHSGLDQNLRRLIENNFVKRQIDFLFATTGLAYGINFPAKTVILCDLMIYQEGKMRDIPVYMFRQMGGRAGRPQFGTEGYAYVVANAQRDLKKASVLLEGNLERAISHIYLDDLFEKAILELIYSDRRKQDEIISFFENTFYNDQSQREKGLIKFDLSSRLKEHLERLVKTNFIRYLGAPGFELTELGEVTLSFLFQTFTNYELNAFLEMNNYLDEKNQVTADFDLIYKLSREFEGARAVKIPRQRCDEIEEFYRKIGITDLSHPEHSAYSLYYGWIENKPIVPIEEDFKIYASALPSVADEMYKLLNAYRALAKKKLLAVPPEFEILMDRIRYGVRGEEVPFVKLRGFGRETVRSLHDYCKTVLAKISPRYKGPMLTALIEFYKDKGESFVLTTLANNVENIGPVRSGKIVDKIKYELSRRR